MLTFVVFLSIFAHLLGIAVGILTLRPATKAVAVPVAILSPWLRLGVVAGMAVGDSAGTLCPSLTIDACSLLIYKLVILVLVLQFVINQNTP